MSTGELIAYGVGLTALLIFVRWLREELARWWRNQWRAFKRAVVWAPIGIPVWLWRRFCLLGVPGWLSERDFYMTPEWRAKAVKNKRDYGNKCAVCGVTNPELPSGSALHSHHVRKRLVAPWLALSDNNLVPLCPTDHRDVEAGRIKLKWNGWRWEAA